MGNLRYSRSNWQFRKASLSIEESKNRGVFVKELNHSLQNELIDSLQFEVFIEGAFSYGYSSINETILIKNTLFPYRVSFNWHPTEDVYIFINKDDLIKFDSSDAAWGFLKDPFLKDTLMLIKRRTGKSDEIIKVW